MAMLAEPKRKQRWTLNPRGKQWSDDSSKFGQRMLEKMGWTHGKGLGANEQGVTDHIRVKYKDDQAGIGFSKDKQEKLWTETQQSFSQLLQQLRAGESPTPAENSNDLNLSGKSLELKSKQSRARVHYKKFTRGKDVNRYSSKDLANIFGKKDLNELPSKVEPQVTELEPVGASDTTAGVLTIKGGSMSDYFKNKLPLMLAKKSANPVNESKDESESESERYVGFGFGLSSNSPATDLPDTPRKRKSQFYVESNPETPTADTVDEHTPKKRKVKDFAFENPGLDLISPDPVAPVNKMEVLRPVAIECIPQVQDLDDRNEVEVQGHEQEKTPKKKKKKKDREQEKEKEIVGFVNDALNLEAKDSGDYSEAFEVSREALGLENDALDLTDESSGKKRVTFNDTVEYNTDKSKKKKSCVKLDKFEIVDDKCRRKKKVKSILVNGEVSSFVNEALDVEIINEEVCDNEVNERKSRGKRKRERRSNLETIEEVEEKVDVGAEVEVEVDVHGRDEELLKDTSDNLGDMSLETPKKKKKSKSKNRDREGRDEFCGNGDKDKDKDKDRMDIDECGNKENLNDSKSSEMMGVKKKKSKKNKKERERESGEEVDGIDGEVGDNKVEVEVVGEFDGSGKSPKVKKAKKILKSLFNKTPAADFVGSNISKIKGYGVE